MLQMQKLTCVKSGTDSKKPRASDIKYDRSVTHLLGYFADRTYFPTKCHFRITRTYVSYHCPLAVNNTSTNRQYGIESRRYRVPEPFLSGVSL